MRYLPYNDICKWKDISALRRFYNDVYCWALKCQYDYNVPIERFKETTKHPADRYLQILSRYDCVEGSEEHIPVKQCLYRSVEQGDILLLRYFRDQIDTKTYKEIYDDILDHAFENANHTLAKEIYREDLTSDNHRWMHSYVASRGGWHFSLVPERERNANTDG